NETSRATIDDRCSVHTVLGPVPHGTRILLHRTLDDAVILPQVLMPSSCGPGVLAFIFRISTEKSFAARAFRSALWYRSYITRKYSHFALVSQTQLSP